MENEDFNILNWWKTNSLKYNIFSYVVRDVLAIPISTVAYESTFSTGGRIIDSFRSSLTTRDVETLIYTQNWIRSSPINFREVMDEIKHIERGK